MSETANPCARFEHIDPLAYLVDRDAEEFAPWKAHFVDCPECSAALAAVSDLEWQLGDLGDAAHPDAVELDAYALRHGLDTAQRARIDEHLESCPFCSDQLRALARFEQATSEATARARQSASDRSPLSGWLETLGEWLRPVPSPVWAGALVLILFALYRVGTAPVDESTPTPRIANQVEQGVEDDSGTVAPELDTPSAPFEEPPPSSSLAERDTPSAPSEAPTNIIEDRTGTGTIEPSAIADAEEPSRGTSPLEETERPELLLAALDLPEILDYRSPGLGKGRFDVLGRGAQPTPSTATPIQVLAPEDHRGLAATTAGVLVWSLQNEQSETVRLMIVDERRIDPVYEVAVEGPHAPGLHAIDLAERGVVLEPGVDYVWSVALEIDPDRPSRASRSRAVLGLVDANADSALRLAAAAPSDRIGTALANGLWYDAVSELARAGAGRSDAERFRSALGDLARAEGIAVAADQPITMHRP